MTQQWRMATWLNTDSGEALRAPAFQARNGTWYRAGEQDGLPCIIRADSEPTAFLTPQMQMEDASTLAGIRDSLNETQLRLRGLETQIGILNSYLQEMIKLNNNNALNRQQIPNGLMYMTAPGSNIAKITA